MNLYIFNEGDSSWFELKKWNIWVYFNVLIPKYTHLWSIKIIGFYPVFIFRLSGILPISLFLLLKLRKSLPLGISHILINPFFCWTHIRFYSFLMMPLFLFPAFFLSFLHVFLGISGLLPQGQAFGKIFS